MTEAELLERLVGGSDVRTFVHWTTSAIDHDIRALRHARNQLPECLDSLRLARGAGKFRVQDVPATVQHWEGYADYRWLLVRGLQYPRQRSRFEQVALRPG